MVPASQGLRRVSFCRGAVLALCVLAWPPPSAAQGRPADAKPRYEVWAQLRARSENRFGAGESAAKEDGLGITRVWLNATLRASKGVRFAVQLNDARVIGLDAPQRRRALEDPLDVREAYVALGPEEGALELRVGRQQMDFVDQRLIGGRRWSNTSPMFDGAQLTIRRGEHRVHLLGFSNVGIRDGFNRPLRSRFLYGAIGSIQLANSEHRLEPFVLANRREEIAASNTGGLLRTAGARLFGRFGETWDYQMIFAGQGGGLAHRPQRAWMGVCGLGKTFDAVPARPRLGFEWSQASGDDDPGDGRTGTFDTLHPSPHRIYGEMDIVSLRNLKFVKAGVDLRPGKRWRLTFDAMDLRVASTRDALYGLSMRAVVRPPAGGAASSSIGQELDLVLRYYPRPNIELRFGASHYFAGPFVTRSPDNPGESQTFLTTALQIDL
ncbi:MAG: alginate export family protein [Bryobacterales bacterium]|nr:alginate export family protein [Bryobacterales bacterium]